MFLYPVLEFMSFLVHLWPLSSPLVPQSRQGLEGCSTHQKGWGLGWMGLPQTSALLEGCGCPCWGGAGAPGMLCASGIFSCCSSQCVSQHPGSSSPCCRRWHTLEKQICRASPGIDSLSFTLKLI